ncbi:hypothetical protein TSOC_004940 [Tetrabaena socialis]|uniref:Uncharacterized protein n=1 Tax=Tetrabaena socialis TaxID=47790 RepID=A0A2J8A7K5_9CHLO|nr:hypothetical protein TSOC_004940 [Tetrabaena socialis]|eukprot:PNH08497.1 hypothetical protein TSOC_004940 [Tetrabaena socialis]
MPQLQDALATAIAAVLVNASDAAAAIARVLPPLPPADGGRGSAPAPAGHRSAHPPRPEEPAADGAGQLAMAAVLWNAQRNAAALGAACGQGVVDAGAATLPHRPPAAAAREPPAAAAREPSAAAAQEPSAAAVREPSAAAAAEDSAAGVMLRAGEKWTREQVEILVDHLRALPPNAAGGGSLAVREAMTKLGLDGLPEPDQRLHAGRVSHKLSKLRMVLSQGLDPFKDRRPRAKNTYHWRAWLRQAFKELPDRTGTLQDAGAIIEADPSIAPLLNQTPDPERRDGAPIWWQHMNCARFKFPEFENTGQKRGRYVLLRYNEEAAEEWTARKAKVPKRGLQSLPYLGKETSGPSIQPAAEKWTARKAKVPKRGVQSLPYLGKES